MHFTGLPNELREIIGSLKMRAKPSNAATCVSSFHQKKENEKNMPYDKMLIDLSEVGPDGNIFGSKSGRTDRAQRPALPISKYIYYMPRAVSGQDEPNLAL